MTAAAVAALARCVPWMGKLIADEAHLNAVAPQDAVGALAQAEAALRDAPGDVPAGLPEYTAHGDAVHVDGRPLFRVVGLDGYDVDVHELAEALTVARAAVCVGPATLHALAGAVATVRNVARIGRSASGCQFDYAPLRPRRVVEEEPRAAVTGDGWRAWEDRAAGRVCLAFDDLERRPAREWNLRWSAQLGAWVRLLSAGGWSAVLAATKTFPFPPLQ